MILLLLIMNLWGQEIVIKGENSEDIAYEKYLMEHPTQQSFIRYQRSLPNHLSKEVFNFLKSAQFEFLNGSLDKAKQFFSKIVNLHHKADWSKEERKIIHFSFLRLAQLEVDTKKKDQWLKQAMSFDHSSPINRTLFPPPLVKRYLLLKSQRQIHVWQLPQKHGEFSKILINGQPIKSDSSFFKSDNSEKRISFYSNTYSPIHLVITPERLQNYKLATTPLASGSCHNPQFNITASTRKDFIFFQKDCLSQLKPKESRSPIDFNPTQHPTTQQKAFYKNKWFLLGTSLVLTVLAVSSLQKKEAPTATAAQRPPSVQTFSNQ